MSRHLPVVLMYHGLGTLTAAADPDNLFVPTEAFAGQLDRLTAKGWTVVGEEVFLAAALGLRPAPPRSVLLTFDDGYVSVHEEAAPLVRARGLSAVCYVSAGLTGRAPVEGAPPQTRLMDAGQIRALPEYGVSVGCHGWEHASMRAMNASDLGCATRTARETLRTMTGRAPRTFAYPYGHHDARARVAVREAGFEIAFATYDGHDEMALARVDINATDTPRSFDLKLSRAYPLVRRGLSRAPAARRLAHRVVGYAERH